MNASGKCTRVRTKDTSPVQIVSLFSRGFPQLELFAGNTLE